MPQRGESAAERVWVRYQPRAIKVGQQDIWTEEEQRKKRGEERERNTGQTATQ